MQGVIIVNPFGIPVESVKQAERLKQELNKLNVFVDIISDGFHTKIEDGEIKTDIKCDFAVYLDKDKYFSKALENSGIRLFNSHDAIRTCDDKAKTYLALSNKGIKMPKTLFGSLCYDKDCKISENSINKIIDELGFPLIIKESFGSMGKGVYKADNVLDLKAIMEKVKLKPHLFQEFIKNKSGTDVRVIVVGGKAVASMERVSDKDFRSNVALGGKCVQIDLPDKFKKTAEKCADILKLDYCGVDLLYGENEEPIVCEVNSNAFFFGIEKATGVNVAKLYAEYIISRL